MISSVGGIPPPLIFEIIRFSARFVELRFLSTS